MEKMRYGIVGALGIIGQTHIEAVEKSDYARLAAICDLDPQKGGKLAREKGVRFFQNWQDLIKSGEVEAVSLCTPHPLHREMAVVALESGLHVLSEKPIASRVSDADRMIQTARRTGKVLAVVYQRRFAPAVVKAKELIDAGQLGPLYRTFMDCTAYKPDYYYSSADWRGTWGGEGGGVLVNQAPHFLDLLQYLGGLPRRIYAWTRAQLHPVRVEDVASALLEYDNGAQGFIHADTVQSPAEQKVAFYGDRAALSLAMGMKLSMVRNVPSCTEYARTYNGPSIYGRPRTEEVELEVPKQARDGHTCLVDDLVQAAREGREPVVTGEEATKTVEIANAITLSSVTGRTVELPIDRGEYDQLLADLISGKAKLPESAG